MSEFGAVVEKLDDLAALGLPTSWQVSTGPSDGTYRLSSSAYPQQWPLLPSSLPGAPALGQQPHPASVFPSHLLFLG